MKDKKLVDWISICPKCDSENILVDCDSSDKVHQGKEAECGNCGLCGSVEVYGPEECDIAWNE
jgi:transcription elongation factor Elf1